MARYCVSCGTEVDDTAVFCPTCGQPIDENAAAEIPAAPAWPDSAASDRAADREGRAAGARDEASTRRDDEPARPDEPAEAFADAPTRVEQRPEAEPASAPSTAPAGIPTNQRHPATASDGSERGGGLPSIDLPLTAPVTLSGWLIGIGSVLAVLGLLVILIGGVLNVIDLLLLLALLGVAATVFLAAQLPGIPHLRLVTLVIALIAFGVALDRIGFRGGGVGELLLFLGTAAATIGAIILELGRDQPLGGSTS